MENENWIKMPEGGVSALPDNDMDQELYLFVNLHYGMSCADYVGRMSEVKAFREYSKFTHYLLLPTTPKS